MTLVIMLLQFWGHSAVFFLFLRNYFIIGTIVIIFFRESAFCFLTNVKNIVVGSSGPGGLCIFR